MILVTGATGLLGSRLAFDLASAGYKVRALRRKNSRFWCIDHYFGSSPELAASIEWVEGDITDLYSLELALNGVSEVYHCAGKVTFQPGQTDILNLINITGTANVVNLSIEAGVKKFCHVSSVAALGRSSNGELINEDTEWRNSVNNSAYAISKYGAEREVWRGMAEGLNAVIVNPGIIIGPGNWKTDSSMLFRRVYHGLKYYTSGISGFVSVKDLSLSMIHLMNNDHFSERFIIVSENLPFREVMDAIADKLDVKKPDTLAGPFLSELAWRVELLRSFISKSKPVITRETARSAQSQYFYSSSKLQSRTGIKFSPVAEAIAETSKVFTEQIVKKK